MGHPMSKTKSVYFSVVVPIYQAAGCLQELIERLEKVLSHITAEYEIILVDDHSQDSSWAMIVALAKQKMFIKGIRLSKNFGQHHAIAAGLDAACGEWIAVMDEDLQDIPEELPRLLSKANYGYDVVLARRMNRKHSWYVQGLSNAFYLLLGYLTGEKQDPAIGNFGVYHKKVIAEVVALKEPFRYFPSMVRWVGFRQTTFNVPHGSSKNQVSGYDFSKRFHLALNTLLAYSDKPLRATIKLGFLIALLGFLFAFITLVRYFLGAIIVPGYASLIVSVWVLSGIMLMTLGLVGLYIGKIFEGVKNRPIYIVDQRT
jgi:polyisoprenyl-phosphate glycosyltransferase